MAPTSVSPAFDKVGYWSPNTSSIDWCENNYTISYYIAEFWNSTSSLIIVAIGLAGYLNLPSYKDRRMTLFMQAFMTIGLGSVLFHGTLRHKMQLLDELPMLYSATIGMFICIETHFGKQGRRFPIAIAIWLVVTTIIFSTTSGTLHLVAAATVWLIDYNLCVYINGVSPESVLRWNPQFHAWWHFLSAYGVYSQSVLIMYYHYDIREMKPEIVMWKGVLPTVTLKPIGKKVD
ncbi:Alkaline ceramidase 3 [Linnemannia elongata]|nr:Alkaline ceramidase 3 [Linnemannia elongata]